MAVYIACCLPDGTCMSLGPCTAQYDCVAVCNSMGGSQYGGATIFADACAYYQDNATLPPGATLCGVGRCTYTPTSGGQDVCEEITYADCQHRSETNSFFPGLTCPTTIARNRAIKSFLIRERAWPYRAEWAMASRGIEYVCCIPGMAECQLLSHQACQELGGTWTPSTFVRKRGTAWPWYLDGNYQDPTEAMQLARMYLDRRLKCWTQDYTAFLPFTTKTQCEQGGGIWRWDGIPYLSPAAGHAFTEIRDCVKRIKLFQQLGFWFPDAAPVTSGCYTKDTFAPKPQYTTEQTCTNAGHIWRQAAFVKPPSWSGQIRYSTRTPNVPAPEHYFKHSEYAENFPYAGDYQYMVLLPVEPLTAFPPNCCVNGNACVPYCSEPDAPARFPFTDTRTYEIPCYTFNHNLGTTFVDGTPYRNRTFGDNLTPPTVPAGLRAIVGYSTGDAQVGSIKNYCGNGCPQNYDCEAIKCEDLWENLYRKYNGITAPRKFDWTDDPQKRGWAVTYITEIKAWFVQDSLWDLQPRELSGQGGLQPPTFRWNAWYEGETRCIASGDVNDSDFKAWILTHDSGFGLKFYPRYAGCNDVFQKFEGLSKSLGDSIFPSALAQNQCLDHTTNPNGDKAPCAKIGKLSSWYRPDVTGAPVPHVGLYHETERKRYADPMQQTYSVSYGWAKLAFSTKVPQLIQATE